jgi:Mn2+/Fe2+ NRAMP family transporter
MSVAETSNNPSSQEEIPAHSWAKPTPPGLVSAATDNDPSGLATYSLAGAQFGYDMLWICVLSYPSMVAFQLVAARIAALTGNGLTVNMRKHYSRVLFYIAVARFLIANIFNIAADIVAMGIAAQLLWRGSIPIFAALFGLASVTLQWFIPYVRYAQVLKWLTLTLFAYVGVAVAVDMPWETIGIKSLMPRITWSEHYFTVLLAVLGTTISPYLLFSQADQQVEEKRPQVVSENKDFCKRGRQSIVMRRNTMIRTALSNGVGFFVMAAAAATLHLNGNGLNNARDAARVIEPAMGGYAPIVLALAFIGTAFLALPPLAGSAAHAAVSAVDQQNDAHQDDGHRNRRIALALLAVMALGVSIGVTLTIMRVEPIQILYWGAVVNGSTAMPIMVLLVMLSTKRSAVGDLSAHWLLRALCWLATVCAGAALVARFACNWFP